MLQLAEDFPMCPNGNYPKPVGIKEMLLSVQKKFARLRLKYSNNRLFPL